MQQSAKYTWRLNYTADYMSVAEFDSVVSDLGIVLNKQLSVGPQVTAVSRSCFSTRCSSSALSKNLWKKTFWDHCVNSCIVGWTTVTLCWQEQLVFR